MYKSCKYIALGRTYEFAPTHFETLHNYNRYAPPNRANHLPRTRITPPALRH